MSPLRKVHASLNVNSWQFWILTAFFFMAAWGVWGYIENHNRIDDLHEANIHACFQGNDSRAALRATFAKMEALIAMHEKPNQRAASAAFFNAWLGPQGRRADIGPLRDRPC